MTVYDPIWPKLTELAACLCSLLDAEDLPPVCRCNIIPGQQRTDDFVGNESCLNGGQDGQAWVRLANAYHTTSFPNPAQFTGCDSATYLAFNVEIGVIRTAAAEANGEPVSADLMMAMASNQITEMLVMEKAFRCCYRGSKIANTLYTPYGPQGFAIGGTWTFTVSAEGEDD